MANEEHLKILKQGVRAWDQWRKKIGRPDLSQANLIEADLRGADLSKADLSKANLNGANLIKANLSYTSLNGANLIDADLSSANLHKANLNGANLSGANLSGANLSGEYFFTTELREANLIEATLSGADLSWADLSGADLRGADLSWADLSGADLRGADLSKAKLIKADLSGADLSGADLCGADLSGADLSGADLSKANLNGANLSGADLSETDLSYVDFRNAVLSKSKLTGTVLLGIANNGWKIDEVSCDYIYQDFERKKRYPQNRNFLPNEFERSYQDVWDTIIVEFTRARYGQLFPIEHALKITLGDDYIVGKSQDRIIVKLDSANQFQLALDAIIPVLAALDSVSKGEVKEISLEPRDGQHEHLSGEELRSMLQHVIGLLEEKFPPDRQKLSAPEEAFIEAVKDGATGFLALGLRKWFELGSKAGDALYDASFQIYERFHHFFHGAKGVVELPSAQRCGELPRPKADTDEEQNVVSD